MNDSKNSQKFHLTLRISLHTANQRRSPSICCYWSSHQKKKNRKSSKLDGIEGLGPVKKRELLKQFGGIQGVLIASIDDLRKVRGISKGLAVRISNTYIIGLRITILL